MAFRSDLERVGLGIWGVEWSMTWMEGSSGVSESEASSSTSEVSETLSSSEEMPPHSSSESSSSWSWSDSTALEGVVSGNGAKRDSKCRRKISLASSSDIEGSVALRLPRTAIVCGGVVLKRCGEMNVELFFWVVWRQRYRYRHGPRKNDMHR